MKERGRREEQYAKQWVSSLCRTPDEGERDPSATKAETEGSGQNNAVRTTDEAPTFASVMGKEPDDWAKDPAGWEDGRGEGSWSGQCQWEK